MSCCSFDGQGSFGYYPNNDKSQRITEMLYDDWMPASGGPTRYLPPLMDRTLPKNFGDIPGMGNPNARTPSKKFGPGWYDAAGRGPAGANCCDNPEICGDEQSCNGCECMTTTRTAAGDPWYTTLQGRTAINTSALQSRPDWTTRRGTNFDGGAVKKNWIPLVVLGLSLVVGIGLSEWATKKYIK